MSKAFTKEGDGTEGDDDDPSPLSEADEDEKAEKRGGPRYITRPGYDNLRAELDRLWHEERPRVTADVQAAAAQGDRSENAEYIYGKKRLREIDRRIRFLSKRLETLTVVDTRPTHDDGRVYFGAWVEIEDEDEARLRYRIVGGDESDLSKRFISVDSPVAKALLGKKVGDTVTIVRPKGAVDVTILSVRYE